MSSAPPLRGISTLGGSPSEGSPEREREMDQARIEHLQAEVMRLNAAARGKKAGSAAVKSDEEGKPEEGGEPDEEMDRVLKELQKERERREALEKELARLADRAAAGLEEAGGEPAALVALRERERQLELQLEETEARYNSEKEKATAMTLAVHPHTLALPYSPPSTIFE